MTAPTRPVLRWHGGKWLLAPWIIGHFPRHHVYIEPFGGAASVLLQKPQARAEVYNDLDGRVVNLFRVLRDPAKADELHRRIFLTPFARAEFDWSYQAAVDDVDDAHRLIILSFMGHGSDSASRGCRTGFRAKMTGSGRALPSAAWARWHETIGDVVARLREVTIECTDASKLMARYDARNVLFYVDPPYLPETRSALAGRSQKTHGYRHEMDRAAHVRLLDLLRRLEGLCVLSGYPNELYDAALPGWRRVECAALADGARPRTEVLWINPAAAMALDVERGGIGAVTPLFARAE